MKRDIDPRSQDIVCKVLSYWIERCKYNGLISRGNQEFYWKEFKDDILKDIGRFDYLRIDFFNSLRFLEDIEHDFKNQYGEWRDNLELESKDNYNINNNFYYKITNYISSLLKEYLGVEKE